LIGRALARGSSTRRLATRAVVVLGAVLVGGQWMRSAPREQTLIFPVGSVFPNATHFAASWKQLGDEEPRGGVSLFFDRATAPLQIRQRAKLPNGDYIVTVDILQAPLVGQYEGPGQMPEAGETSGRREGLQTNIERRVNLAGGEVLIVLAPIPREPSVAQ